MQDTKQSRTSLKSLGAIVAHPLRTRIWTALTERTASPNELRLALDASLSDVAYHVRALEKIGVIELVETKPVRGALEHFYRATERAFSDDEDTASRSLKNREELARHTLQLSFADAAVALDARTFCERPEHCVARVPLTVDEEGWGELNAAYRELLDRIMTAATRSTERMSAEDPGTRVTALASFFEVPAGEQGERAA
jgi:hypothetical protein